MSRIDWKFEFPAVAKPREKKVEIWNVFKTWLKQRRIYTLYNFEQYCNWKLKLSNNETILRVKQNEAIEYYNGSRNENNIIIY